MEQKKDSSMMHQWIYVIIPATIEMYPLFAAHCKNCRANWTEFVKFPNWTELEEGEGVLSQSKMPIWGCVMPPIPGL